jgi:hypothetical protein
MCAEFYSFYSISLPSPYFYPPPKAKVKPGPKTKELSGDDSRVFTIQQVANK